MLDVLDLPATSQVINAAGKFMIVAPNSEQAKTKLQQLQQELDHWFLEHSFGQAGVGLAWTEATCNDFCRHVGVTHSSRTEDRSPYRLLIDKLFEQMEIKKCQRFDLCARDGESAVFKSFLDSFDKDKGVCKIDGRSPATEQLDAETFISKLAWDQYKIGEWLTRFKRILISRESLVMATALKIQIFGYHVSFVENEDERGRFGEVAKSGGLLRAWDFSLPESGAVALWNGYARRNINAYVPVTTETDKLEEQWEKYIGIDETLEVGAAKTLNHLACCDRRQTANGKWQGISALSALKGDVDNLGMIFQSGLDDISFSKTAALSRQLNNFFAVYLPCLCQSEFRDSYTVFAGGDDFFLIGPWFKQIRLAERMRQAFQTYVAGNPDIHFSAGISTTKPGLPIGQLAELAEEGLEQSKAYNPNGIKIAPKNAVSCFNQLISWEEFDALLSQRLPELQRLTEKNDLSTGYVYGLLNLIDMKEKETERPENALWHSYFAYRTARMLDKQKFGEDKQKAREERSRRHTELAIEIADAGIQRHQGNYRVALFCHLYQQRD